MENFRDWGEDHLHFKINSVVHYGFRQTCTLFQICHLTAAALANFVFFISGENNLDNSVSCA